MRISDWSSDVCSSDLSTQACSLVVVRTKWSRWWIMVFPFCHIPSRAALRQSPIIDRRCDVGIFPPGMKLIVPRSRSEEHTSELQSLMRISYAVFCLKKKQKKNKRERSIHKEEKETNKNRRRSNKGNNCT